MSYVMRYEALGVDLNRLNAARLSSSVEAQLFVVLALLAATFAALYPDQFATTTNLTNMSRTASILLVVAIGQMLVLLIGGFDLSVGATMGFTSVISALAMRDYGFLVGVAVALLAATAVGFLNGVLIARLRVSPFVATLGTLTFITGLGNELSDGRSVSGLPSAFAWFGRNDWGRVPSTVGIAVVAGILIWFVLNRTRFGLYLYSIGGSRETCVLSGVPVVRYEIAAFTICGFLAGVAGLMLTSRVTVGQTSLGTSFELLSIATAVIGGVAIGGGVGRLSGVIAGVALLAVLRNGLDLAGLSQFTRNMVTGVVLVLAVLTDNLRGGSLMRFIAHRRSKIGPTASAPADERIAQHGADADGPGGTEKQVQTLSTTEAGST